MSIVADGNSGRIAVIEHVKGVAIILVVAAHLVKYRTLDAAAWYEVFKYKVYLFHMPLFMFASGYVYFHTRAHQISLSHWPAYVLRRADRLLVPFLVLGACMAVGKLVLSDFTYVDEAPATLGAAFAGMLVDTEESSVLTIWYLFVLFAFCLATPLLYRLFARRMTLLALFAASLYPLAVPDVLFANRLCDFYLFFVAGGVAQSLRLLEHRPGPRCSLLLGMGFAALLALPLSRGPGLVVCGLCAALAVPALLQHAPQRLLAILHFCGRNSMCIYLFNVIAIGVAKGVFLHLFAYEAALFVPLLCVTFCAGIGAPLLLRWASGRSRHTALIHRYIS